MKNGGEGLISSDRAISFSFTCVPCEEMRVELVVGRGPDVVDFATHRSSHLCANLPMSVCGMHGRVGRGTHNTYGHTSEVG